MMASRTGQNEETKATRISVRNDLNQSLVEIRQQSVEPLYQRLIDIERRARRDDRLIAEIRCVKTTETTPTHGRGSFPTTVDLHYDHPLRNGYKYIAVSCPWEVPGTDGPVTFGKYRIEPDTGMQEIKLPQDIVLERVIKFAAAHNFMPSWIDKLRVEQQEGHPKKEEAVQSMDVVYESSTCTIGLLFIRLDRKDQVERLESLLSERDYRMINGDYRLTSSLAEAFKTLEVIELILQDQWWKRAWIFQEEYLSSLRMRLLIRSSQYPNVNKKIFGCSSDELEVHTVEFRKASTRLCLALQNEKLRLRDRDRITRVLQTAGRYSDLLVRDEHPDSLMLMSPAILQELGNRNISVPEDILAIAANACGYLVRLDPDGLQGTLESLSLSLLTLYIINGDILCHHSRATSRSQRNIFEFIKHNALPVDPPLGPKAKGLTFAKHCRFPYVTLSPDGIETEGIIWSLGPPIDSRRYLGRRSTPPRVCRKIDEYQRRSGEGRRKYFSLPEYRAVWLLYDYVQRHGYDSLRKQLSIFLKEDIPCGYVEDWKSGHIKHLMARCIARAIINGKILRLGCIENEQRKSPYTGIFVQPTNNSRKRNDKNAFTSWAAIRQGGEVKYVNYVSLLIDCDSREPKPPRIVPQRWMNGLCFFERGDTRKVIVEWPHCLRDFVA